MTGRRKLFTTSETVFSGNRARQMRITLQNKSEQHLQNCYKHKTKSFQVTRNFFTRIAKLNFPRKVLN